MRIAGFIENSVVNGIGIRDVVFVQGCYHHCKDCHNPETWDFRGGKQMRVKDVADHFANSSNDVTISGGEPLCQIFDVWHLCDLFKRQGKRIWLYTGCTYENIENVYLEILARYVDVLVDGQFQVDKKDLKLRFRGSSNQRLIDLPKSVAAGQVILWEDNNDI